MDISACLVLQFTEQKKAPNCTAVEDSPFLADYRPITSWHPLEQQGQSQLANKSCNEIYFLLSLWLAFYFCILLTKPRALCDSLRASEHVHEHAQGCTCSHLCSWGTPHWPGSWTPYKHHETRRCTPSPIRTCGERGEKNVQKAIFQLRYLRFDFRGQSHLSLRHNSQSVTTDRV